MTEPRYYNAFVCDASITGMGPYKEGPIWFGVTLPDEAQFFGRFTPEQFGELVKTGAASVTSVYTEAVEPPLIATLGIVTGELCDLIKMAMPVVPKRRMIAETRTVTLDGRRLMGIAAYDDRGEFVYDSARGGWKVPR